MNPDDRLRGLLQKLIERSKRDEVSWQLIGTDYYRTDFPASAVSVRFLSPSSAPDYYRAALLNAKGQTVVSLDVYEGHADWDLMQSIVAEAYRSVTGWDKAMEDAESALEAKGPIEAKAVLSDDDDIPF